MIQFQLISDDPNWYLTFFTFYPQITNTRHNSARPATHINKQEPKTRGKGQGRGRLRGQGWRKVAPIGSET